MKKKFLILVIVLAGLMYLMEESAGWLVEMLLAISIIAFIFLSSVAYVFKKLKLRRKNLKSKCTIVDEVCVEGLSYTGLNNSVDDISIREIEPIKKNKTIKKGSVALMSKISLPGQTKVGTLQKRFKDEFSLTLRVYDGRKYADPDATLGQVRKLQGAPEIEIAKHMKIASLEKKFEEQFGLKVKVSGSDDSYLCDGEFTLKKAIEEDSRKIESRRPIYSEEFKRSVAAAANIDGVTLGDVSEEYNVSIGSVRNWKAEYGSRSIGQNEPDVLWEVLSESTVSGFIDHDGDLSADLQISEAQQMGDTDYFMEGEITLRCNGVVEEREFEHAFSFGEATAVRSGYVRVADSDEIAYELSVNAQIYKQVRKETTEVIAKKGAIILTPAGFGDTVFQDVKIDFDSDGDPVIEGEIRTASDQLIAYSFDRAMPDEDQSLWPVLVNSEHRISSCVVGARKGSKIYVTLALYEKIAGRLNVNRSGTAKKEAVEEEARDSASNTSSDIVNIVEFFVDSDAFSEVNDGLSYGELEDDDKIHFIKNAAYEVSGVFSNYIGDDSLHVSYLVLNENNKPKQLISLSDIDSGEFSVQDLLGELECSYLVLCHSDADWNYTCLKVSEGLNDTFWAIGKTENGDIVRQEYDCGDLSEGYFLDEDECLNEPHIVAMFGEVQQILVARKLAHASGGEIDDVNDHASSEYWDAGDVEGKYMEVLITNLEEVEFVYWVNLAELPEDEDEYDWSIKIAVSHHNSLGIDEVSEDDAEACEPFSRDASEFVFINP